MFRTAVSITCMTYTYSCVYSTRLLMMDRKPVRNMQILIFMDPSIVDNSVEIPTRCSFVIEFIIPEFIEGSTCFERHPAHHQEL